MAILYAIAQGFNQPDESLTPLTPQPFCEGVQAERQYTAGAYYESLHYVELVWPLADGDEQYRDILVQLGLNEADTAQVTLRIRDDNYLAWRVNATIFRPEHGREVRWQFPFPRNATFLARIESEASA